MSDIVIMPNERISRYEIPLDGEPHTVRLSGAPLAAVIRDDEMVFWAREGDAAADRRFAAIRTGEFPGVARYYATATRDQDEWHLVEVYR